jgi:trans-2,3-dihydro-3-hydroxyanthranilate isomerase
MLQTHRNKFTNITVRILSVTRGKTTPNNTFYIVDVFGQEKYSGNQLAVITNAENLTEMQMQKIANETHFSETTFITSNSQTDGSFKVRIFTPSTEVPFAGHPTLGTAYIIKHFVEKDRQQILLDLKVGKIPVTFEKKKGKEETLWMQQKTPLFGKIFSAKLFEELLSLQIDDFDLSFPIQQVSTGLPFVIIPLKTLDAVKRARINQNALTQFIKETQAGILVFCLQTYQKENKLNVRVFVDVFGIPEDPATGSGNGCLAAYLVEHQYFGSSKIDISVEQGFEIHRPSILYLKAQKKLKDLEVSVGGKVILVARGELF